MAILFMEGCDFQIRSQTTKTYAPRWNGGAAGNPFFVAGTGAQGGAAGLNVYGNNNARKTLAANYSTLIVNFWLTQRSTNSDARVQFRDGTTDQCTVVFKQNGNVEVRTGGVAGTLITTLTGVITTNAYQWVGIKLVFAGGGAGSYDVEINEVNVGSGSGTTITTANAYANDLVFNSSSNTNPPPLFDDIVVMDTTGSFNNDLLPKCIIMTKAPIGDVTQGWTRSAGSTNYTLVDDVPTTEDTDYVSANDGAATTDKYTMAGNIRGGEVFAVQTSAVIRSTTGGTANWNSRLDAVSSGVNGATVDVTSTTYQYLQDIAETNPDTTAQWLFSEISGLKVSQVLA